MYLRKENGHYILTGVDARVVKRFRLNRGFVIVLIERLLQNACNKKGRFQTALGAPFPDKLTFENYEQLIGHNFESAYWTPVLRDDVFLIPRPAGVLEEIHARIRCVVHRW